MSDREDQPIVVVEKKGSSVGAFLLGAAVGAVAGLLFAPRSGEETRREIEEGADRIRQDAERKLSDLRQEVEQAYDRVRTEMEEGLAAARSEVEGRRRQAGEAVRAGREAAREAREDLEARMAEGKAAAGSPGPEEGTREAGAGDEEDEARS